MLSHCRGVLLFETHDEAVIVRRAAVYLIHALITGAEDAFSEIVENQSSFIRHILNQAAMDRDDIVKGHALACLKILSAFSPLIEVI